jgi:hypothetical protein
MGGWGCPHEYNGVCQKVNHLPCDPGMKGCVLYGRVVFSNQAKNPPHLRSQAAKDTPPQGAAADPQDS